MSPSLNLVENLEDTGMPVALSIQNDREFARFCDKVLGQPSLASDPRFAAGPARYANRDATHAEIERVFSRLTAAQVIERLDAAGIANARLNTMEEFWTHPQLEARDRWRSVDSPQGPLQALLPPFNLSGFEAKMGPLPALGEHTRPILAELGLSEAEIERFAGEGLF